MGAFLPAPLPYEIPLRQETSCEAGRAQEALGRLDARIQDMPAADKWANQALLREMKSSAWLDGLMIASREAYVLGATVDGTHGENNPFVGYFRSGLALAEAARAGRPLTVNLLGRVSAIMQGNDGVADLQEGDRWRTGVAWLGGPDPASAYMLAAPDDAQMWIAAEQWCSWMRTQNEMLVAVKLALAFVQFLLLSPFPGAAHLARLVINHELVVSGVLAAPVLPLSDWLYRHRDQLPALIHGVVVRSDFDQLVSFFAKGIRAVCDAEEVRIKKSRDFEIAVTSRHVARKTSIIMLIEALAVMPVMTMRQVAETCGITTTQARNLANQLHEEGIVEIIDAESFQYQGDDPAAYRRIIVVPGVLQVLDIFPPVE